MTRLSFAAHGTPRPKQSGRWVGGRMRPIAAVHAPLRRWSHAVASAALEAMAAYPEEAARLYRAPVRLSLSFFMPTPRAERWGKLHTHAPDVDNLRKAVTDVLVKVGLLEDDKRVCAEGGMPKRWAQRGGVLVELAALDSATMAEPESDELGAKVLCRPAWLTGH